LTGVFLQVRLDSSRLPNKALLELGGRSVIEHAMLSLKRVPASVHAIVTDSSSRSLLESRARRCGFETFVGPDQNVLERYVLAARHFGVATVVRATGDNPLVSWELARLALAELRRRDADYCGYDGPPLGTGVEIVSATSLERAVRETVSSYDREHVTPYLYRHPELFAAFRLPCPEAYCLPHARVTLDTHEDYRRLRLIFEEVYAGAPIPLLRLVRMLRDMESVSSNAAQEVNVYSPGA
jgi:spore coat polysaccharide biosynthesis protein SpsF